MDKPISVIKGLGEEEIIASRKSFGENRIDFKKELWLVTTLKSLLHEPMLILLLLASVIYFLTGDTGDGIFLGVAILVVASISILQDARSSSALKKLEIFTQPFCKVIRNSETLSIHSNDLVIGDFMMVEEGMVIAADATIVKSNDFSVNESILTGESLPVYKDALNKDNIIYKGTTVASGLAIATVTAIGNGTKLAKIGKSVENIKEEKTPLEIQINAFVKKMAIAGLVVFLIVWAINYFKTYALLDSLLKALTLAMSILPEEIPVAFTTFMALGAWRLIKIGVLVKQMKTVETLGSATVLCTDKTGTLTKNQMQLAKLYSFASDTIANPNDELDPSAIELIRFAMWSSEPIPFDPMETELHKIYTATTSSDERALFEMIHEYPLGGQPPMMTHIYANKSGERIIAAKGATEAILAGCKLSAAETNKIEEQIKSFSQKGYRVLGVAKATDSNLDFPKTQQEISLAFLGLVAFYDPPKENIKSVLSDFEKAGIAVKIVTGDNVATTTAIAQEINFKGYDQNLSGDALMQLSEEQLQEKVKDTQLFYRMFPEAKLRIINAFKANGEIVAMTGDGVNDGPALKAAHIGIAMGKKGTEIAKQAASLILVEDDFSKMVEAISMGRRIYANLKKAIQYIISIHIPIILTVFIPLALGWVYPNIFSPVHVIFLELIMGPTCSIIYENEPIEKNSMLQPPRKFNTSFFNWNELLTSVIQGICITAGVLGIYLYAVANGASEATTRTMVFLTLVTANIFLTLVNRSFYYSIFTTLLYKNKLVGIIIGITTLLTVALLCIKPLTIFFGFSSISIKQALFSCITGFAVVIWFELVKLYTRKKSPLNAVAI